MSNAARKMLLRTSWKFVLTALFVTGTHSQLFGGVDCGDKLRITLNDGRRFSGQFHGRTADTIGIVNGSNYQWLLTDEIGSIEKGKKHTLYGLAFGALIGLGIGGYIYGTEDKAAREQFQRELDYSATCRRSKLSISEIGGFIHDANSPLRYYPPPPQYDQPSPWLIFGPAIGGAVLGAIIGNSIYTYKSISWSVIPPGYCTLPDRTEHNNYSIRFQLRL